MSLQRVFYEEANTRDQNNTHLGQVTQLLRHGFDLILCAWHNTKCEEIMNDVFISAVIPSSNDVGDSHEDVELLAEFLEFGVDGVHHREVTDSVDHIADAASTLDEFVVHCDGSRADSNTIDEEFGLWLDEGAAGGENAEEVTGEVGDSGAVSARESIARDALDAAVLVAARKDGGVRVADDGDVSSEGVSCLELRLLSDVVQQLENVECGSCGRERGGLEK